MRRAVAVVLAIGLLAAPLARADDLADAKASFRRGVELYKAQRWKEAMEEFQAAYRTRPHGALHFNVAQCRERLDDWPGTIRSYRDYLREVPSAADRDAVAVAVKRLEEKLARGGVQVLLLDSSPPGARVVIEGLERGRTPLHVVLQPGTYAVALSLEGYTPWAQRVEMGAARSEGLDVALKATGSRTRGAELAARPPAAGAAGSFPLTAPARPRRHLPAWIAAGTAAAATVAAVAYGASARADQRAIDALSSPSAGTASSKASSVASKHRTANVLYGLAGGAAAVSATLFLVEWTF